MMTAFRKLSLFILTLILCNTGPLHAQSSNNCQPLFSGLTNFKLNECETKEFAELEIKKKTKTGSTTENKQGEYMKVTYTWQGEWEKRPSMIQILQNYNNAITKAGGEVLSMGPETIYGKVKSGGEVYYIKVQTDGTSYYWYYSVREASMRQDVVLTPAEIKTGLQQEGKMSFYGIYFDTDKSTLKPESAPTLTAIAGFLRANAAINAFIVGHTDNSGSFEHNFTLSKERAAAVVSELTTKYGVNKSQLTPQGVGSLAPVASNDTEQGKAKNRRVELVKK